MLDLCSDHCFHWVLVSIPVLPAPVDHCTVGALDYIPGQRQKTSVSVSKGQFMLPLGHRAAKATNSKYFQFNKWVDHTVFAIPTHPPLGSVVAGLTQTRRRWPSQTTVSQTRPSFWEPLLPPSLLHSRPEKFSTDLVKQVYFNIIYMFGISGSVLALQV